MEGQLSEHPFAELISEILEKKFSGALRVVRERARAVVYFEAGELIYATANLRNLRLVEYLKKRGIKAEAITAKDSASDFTVADALVSRGLVTSATLDQIIAEQVSDVVRVLLLWTSGQWAFDERTRLTEAVRARIQVKLLLLDAARRTDLQFPGLRLSDSGEMISPGVTSAGGLSLSASEGFLLSRVENPIKLGELVSGSGLRDPDARRTIYGLVLTGLLRRASWPFAFRAVDMTNAQSPAKTSPVEAAAPKVESAPPRDPREELTEFLDQMSRATNHYEVLSVPPTADAADVKNAYYSLARRFHPDRFHELARTPLHVRLESAFARITQAHETLTDRDTRSAYDIKIAALRRVGYVPSNTEMPLSSAGEGSTRVDNLQLAEQRFKEGVAALQLGQINTATSCLSAAARLAPNESRYRAYYGRALAAHAQTMRLAEAELQAAVKLDPANAPYRVLLAGLYRDLGFSRRAITELERALALDSKNEGARRMLQGLEAKQ